MKQPRTDRDWAVVATMAFAAGALVAWALMSGQPAGQVSQQTDWPAWVQAVGSVIAIFVAVIVPVAMWRTDRVHRLRQEKAKARSYALHLMPVADKLYNKLRSAHLLYLNSESPDELADIIRLTQEATALEAWGYNIHELGSPGEHVQRALLAAHEAAKLLSDQEFYHNYHGRIVDDVTGEVGEYPEPESPTQKLAEAERYARAASSEIRDLF